MRIIEFMAFKPSGKWYATDTFEIPLWMAAKKYEDDAAKFRQIRQYLIEHRKDIGYSDMTIIIGTGGDNANLIGYPMMLHPVEEDSKTVTYLDYAKGLQRTFAY